MAAELTPEQANAYSLIIDGILATSDLNSISAKQIRKGLQAAVGHDVSSQREAINQLIHQRFDKFSPREEATAYETPQSPVTITQSVHQQIKTNGVKRQSPTPDAYTYGFGDGHVGSMPSPSANKKHKKNMSIEDTDAMYARQLQAEEDQRGARSTRGAGTTNGTAKRKAPANGGNGNTPAKKKKSKSKARITSDDDENTLSTERKVNRTGGFHKPMGLRPVLADFLGESSMSRPQTVKRIWEYIKANDLQDPSDKRQIVCDERLKTVFGKDRVQMFSMNKILSGLLYTLDE